MKKTLIQLAFILLCSISLYCNAQPVGLNWKEMGPFDMSGPNKYQVLYAPSPAYPYRAFAATLRGIYRSLNYRIGNWSVCGGTDKTDKGIFGAIAQDKLNPDKLYACTGFFSDGGSSYSKSDGVYVTTNGGNTWALLSTTPTNTTAFDGLTSMVVDNNNNIFVSSTATTSTNGSQGGIFEINTSTNALSQVLQFPDPSTANPSGLDVEVNSTSGDVWASSSHMSPSNANPACGAGKLYVSKYATYGINTGKSGNWADVTPTLSNINWGTTTAPTSFCIYWIYSAVTASDPNRIYLRLASSFSSSHLIFRSENGGTNWIYSGTTPDNTGAFFNSKIVADQVNTDVVYTGGVTQWKSLDKGQTWTSITPNTTFNLTPASTISGQQEARDYLVNLNSPGESLLTSDGGIFYSSNNVSTNVSPTFTQVNSGLNINNYGGIDLSPQSGADQWVGAANDNGVHFVTNTGTLLVESNANNGITSHYDKSTPTNPTIQIYSLQNDNNFYQKNGSTITHVAYTQTMGSTSNSCDWDSKALLLYASANAGSFGVVNFTTSTATYYTLTGITNASSYMVSCVKVDPTTAGTVWLGLYSASMVPKLVKVTGANGSSPVFTDMSSSSFVSGAKPSSISFYASGSTWTISKMAVCFTNTSTSRIWQSTSSGSPSSWAANDGTLTSGLIVNDILQVQVPTTISSTGYYFYAATNHGLYFTGSLSGGTTSWTVEDEVPYVNACTICYRTSDAAMAIGTGTSGVWMTKDLSTTGAQADFQLNKTTIAAGEPLIITNTSWGATSYSWNFGDGTTNTNQNPPNKAYSAAGTYTIQLTINGSISVSKTVTVTSTPYYTGLTLNWVEQGPFDLATRANNVIYAPNSTNPFRAFTATARGIYRTMDYRYGNWQLCTGSTQLPKILFGDIAQDKTNPDKLYACTGFYSDGSLTYSNSSKGIYYTTDGGNTWALLQGTQGTFDGVTRMVIDKNDNLFVSSTSNTSASLGGIYCINPTTNAVTQVISNTSTPAFPLPSGLDVEVNATSGDIWASSSHESSIGSSSSPGKVFVSRFSTNGTNTGAVGTWVDVTPTLSNINWNGTTPPTSLDIAWIYSAVTAANTNRVYLMIACRTGLTGGHAVLRSDNAGTSWIYCGYAPQSGGDFFHSRIFADQINPNVVYCGAIYHYKSIDSAFTWGELSSDNNFWGYDKATNLKGHNDPRIFLPNLNSTYPNETIVNCDGGMYYSTNNVPNTAPVYPTSPTFRQINSGLNNNLYYNVDIIPQSGKYNWLGGAQDNAVTMDNDGGTYMDVEGDGGSVHFANSTTVIYTYRNNPTLYEMRTLGSSSATGMTVPNIPASPSTDWDSRASLLYIAGPTGQYVKANFTTLTSSAISITGYSAYNVTWIRVDPTLTNVIWLGLTSPSGGAPKLLKVTNANATPTFTDLSASSFPTGATLSSISFTAGNTSNIAVCFATAGVARTWVCNNITAGTPTWTTIDGNLPSNLTVNDLLEIPSTKSPSGYITLAATNQGLWFTTYFNGSNTFWQADSRLQFEFVYQLCFRSSDATLAACTFGAGVWMTGDAGTATNAPIFKVSNTSLCTTDSLYIYNTSLGTNNTYLWNYGDGTTSTLANPPAHLYSTAGSYTVTLTINGTSSVTKTVTVTLCSPAVIYNKAFIPKQDDIKWNIFPNPSTGLLNIASPKDYKNVIVTIRDLKGQVVFQKRYVLLSSNTQVYLDNNKPAGMYIVDIRDERKILYSGKIVVLRLSDDDKD